MREDIKERLESIIEIPKGDKSKLPIPPIPIIGKPISQNMEKVSLDKIVGTTTSTDMLDKEFRPNKINGRFIRSWRYIWLQNREQPDVKGIILVKVGDYYYVEEGLRRISAFKHQGWSEVELEVKDYSHLMDLTQDQLMKLKESIDKLKRQSKKSKQETLEKNAGKKALRQSPIKTKNEKTPNGLKNKNQTNTIITASKKVVKKDKNSNKRSTIKKRKIIKPPKIKISGIKVDPKRKHTK